MQYTMHIAMQYTVLDINSSFFRVPAHTVSHAKALSTLSQKGETVAQK